MKEVRIVFMGNPKFAVESLKRIVSSKYTVIAVVTNPDKPFGRGQKIHFSPVKEFALSLNFRILQPNQLKSRLFIEELKSLNADIFVIVAFRYLPQSIWNIPRLGTFNLHASLLPDYRGAAPINYVLINGEKITGVTTFLINNQIDKGKILLQKSLSISLDDTAGILHDKLMFLGADLVVETIEKLSKNQIIPIEQPINSTKLAHKLFKKNCKIDWNKNSETIHNFIRGLSPDPCSFTTISINKKIKILKIYKGDYIIKNHIFYPGKIEILINQLRIYTKNGYYFPEIIQVEGKRKMNISDFLHGIQNVVLHYNVIDKN